MFGVDTTEFLIVAVAALIFIGPKELPGTMRAIGRWVGKIRGMARHFTSGIETMMREAELEEMEKKWKADNERIMRDFPAVAAPEPWPQPVADEASPPADDQPAPAPAPPSGAKASRPKAPPARRSPPRRAASPKAPPPKDAQ